MKIDLSKKYTCNGHPVEFLHRRPEGWPGQYQWVGLANGVQQTWTDEGLHYKKYPISDFNLVEVREPLEIELVVTGDGQYFATLFNPDHWDKVNPNNAPHRTAKFREVLP